MTRENGARGGVPDLGGVDEEAETRVVIGGSATDEAPTRITAADGTPTEVTVGSDEAPTHIAMPAPGRPRAGEPGRPASRTATDLVDLATHEEVPTVPLVPEPAPPAAPDRRARAEARPRTASRRRSRVPLAWIAIGLGALLAAAVAAFVTVSNDRMTGSADPADERAPSASGAGAAARSHANRGPVVVGATPASVAPDIDDLERRAIDLVAAHRYSEALPLYDDLVAGSPSRRELALARDLVRARAEAEGEGP